MSARMTAAGVKLLSGAEETAGTRPTAASAYSEVSDELKKTPEFNPNPETHEATTFKDAAAGYATYVKGYRKSDGALPFTFNLTEDFITAWGTLITSFETAKAAGKAMWFCVEIPGLTQCFYFAGEPEALGLPSLEASGGVAEIEAYIIPTKFAGMAAKPTT